MVKYNKISKRRRTMRGVQKFISGITSLGGQEQPEKKIKTQQAGEEQPGIDITDKPPLLSGDNIQKAAHIAAHTIEAGTLIKHEGQLNKQGEQIKSLTGEVADLREKIEDKQTVETPSTAKNNAPVRINSKEFRDNNTVIFEAHVIASKGKVGDGVNGQARDFGDMVVLDPKIRKGEPNVSYTYHDEDINNTHRLDSYYGYEVRRSATTVDPCLSIDFCKLREMGEKSGTQVLTQEALEGIGLEFQYKENRIKENGTKKCGMFFSDPTGPPIVDINTMKIITKKNLSQLKSEILSGKENTFGAKIGFDLNKGTLIIYKEEPPGIGDKLKEGAGNIRKFLGR
jgi:hypothetical protein